MRWKLLGFVCASAVVAMVPAFGWPAAAGTTLSLRSRATVATGVTFSSYLDSSPTNAINVIEIASAAPVVVSAVPASLSGGPGTAPLSALCARADAVGCVNGDFFAAGGPLGGELVGGRWLKAPTRVQQQLWLDSAHHFSIGAQPATARQSLGATSYAILLPGRSVAIPEHDSFAEGRFARTLVGWDGSGDAFLVTVDQGAGSAGMSLAEAATLMHRLGATTAVNEDGGGSSQMIVAGSRQAPSGEEARPVANAWAVTAAPAVAAGASAAPGAGSTADGFPASMGGLRPTP